MEREFSGQTSSTHLEHLEKSPGRGEFFLPEELYWPVTRKGWEEYWFSHLLEDPERLPTKQVRDILEKWRLASESKKKMSADDIRIIQTYISGRIRRIRQRFSKETIRSFDRKLRSLSNRERLSRISGKNLRLPADRHSSVKEITKPLVESDSQISADDQNIDLEQLTEEERDILWPVERSGWKKYWMAKLANNRDILPSPLRDILEKAERVHSDYGGLLPAEQNIIFEYVRHRYKDLQAILSPERVRILIALENKMTLEELEAQYKSERETVRGGGQKFELSRQAAMEKLRTNLRRIDRKEMPEEENRGRRVLYDPERGELLVDNGKLITMGDIVADHMWGVTYAPDNSVPPSLWRKISKRIAVTEAKMQIFNASNKELIREKRLSAPTTAIAIEELEYLLTRGGMKGIIAERMAQSFLTRLEHDCPEIGIKVEPANAEEDTMMKYDFKIIVTSRHRGIAVESDEMPRLEYIERKKAIGVQFTVSRYIYDKRNKVEEAKRRLSSVDYRGSVKNPVDDIVLISLPFDFYGECFVTWLERGKPSGGPEQFLPAELKRKLLKKVLGGIRDLSDEELREMVKE